MRQVLTLALALCCATAGVAAPEFSGQLRPAFTEQRAAASGPLAQAAALVPGIVRQPASSAALETELRAGGHGLTAVGTLRQERLQGEQVRGEGWVNELYISDDAGAWFFSAGKKIVGWDVGYGWRPNDVVQQETRRTLLSSTAEGRPLLMAEYFDTSTAWSLVLVNPNQPRAQRGAQEPALALRWYQRNGALDVYAFARQGAHTGGSVGAAAAWVANEALELHASLRWLDAADTLRIDPAASGLVRNNPWAETTMRRTTQALLGGTWTNASQLSLLLEAWWDGTALSDSQWDAWNLRNSQLTGFVGSPAPAAAVAGNLAWQGSAFGAASNLRRSNLFARLSWQHDKWQPALDLLLTPADGGRVVTASLGWQGDRVRFDTGLRQHCGPADAVLAQLPTRRVAYAAATWSF